ncbi:MAG: hypothetical protein Q8O89_03190 [Nanoarchaeota archaeon]|nr:hypothetical protein [Nanoarchaeota archaeon]
MNSKKIVLKRVVLIEEKSDRQGTAESVKKNEKRSFIPSFLSGKKHVVELKGQVDADLKGIRDELEDHLDSINANSSELDVLHDYLAEIDSKLNKINERLDEIQMFTGMSDRPEFKHYEKITLTLREQEVFLVLYTSNHFITYSDVCRRLSITQDMVKKYIKSIVSKGIAVIEKHSKDELFIALDPIFRDLQAKENIVVLNQSVLNAFSY